MTDKPRTDGPSGIFFPAFLAGIDQLGQLLHLAWAGAGTSSVLGDMVGSDPNADPKAVLLGKFGKEQVSAGFPLLYDVVTVRLDSILDAVVQSFVKRHAAKRLVGKRPKKLYGVDRHEWRMGHRGTIPPEVRQTLLELSATRDVIVHQLGRADDRFVRRCPWLKLEAGDTVRINNAGFVSYQWACSWYVVELSVRALQAGEVGIPDTREGLLAYQARMMEKLRSAIAARGDAPARPSLTDPAHVLRVPSKFILE